jgi:hypothetical protein
LKITQFNSPPQKQQHISAKYQKYFENYDTNSQYPGKNYHPTDDFVSFGSIIHKHPKRITLNALGNKIKDREAQMMYKYEEVLAKVLTQEKRRMEKNYLDIGDPNYKIYDQDIDLYDQWGEK